MNVADLKARVSRLEALARGLAKEAGLWDHEDALLLFPEKKLYLNGILDALAGAEQARRVLAEVVQRVEGKRRRAL